MPSVLGGGRWALMGDYVLTTRIEKPGFAAVCREQAQLMGNTRDHFLMMAMAGEFAI